LFLSAGVANYRARAGRQGQYRSRPHKNVTSKLFLLAVVVVAVVMVMVPSGGHIEATMVPMALAPVRNAATRPLNAFSFGHSNAATSNPATSLCAGLFKSPFDAGKVLLTIH
jgi:hypothetical protein